MDDGDDEQVDYPARSDPAPDGFVAALADAVAASGTTLAHLRRQLAELGTPVSVTTLSYWRSGRRRPDGTESLLAVANIETLLDLPAGRLTGAVGPSRRREASLTTRLGPNDHVDAVLRVLDTEADAGLVDDSLQHVIDVDEAGHPSMLWVRCLHRATRDDVRRRVMWLTVKHPDGRARPFTALAGGHFARAAEDREHGVYAAEFVFDRPLRAGDTVVIEYQVELGPADERFYELDVARKLRHAMVWVRFHKERVPPRVEVYREVRGRRAVQVVDMTATTSVHHAVSGRVSGRIGVRWSWT